jgi:hypothetical protein
VFLLAGAICVYDVLQSLRLSLFIPTPAQRTRLDKDQTTSLVRAVLEFSSGRMDFQHHGLAEEYTTDENTASSLRFSKS